MTSTFTRRLAAVTGGLAALVATVAVAAPASAETFSKSDPAGDVAGPDGQYPNVTNGDIRRVRFEHGRRNVTIRADFRDLAKEGGGIEQYMRIDTPAGSYQLVVIATPENWRGEFFIVGSESACGGADHRLDYGRDRFTLSVPRGCLAGPRWVRVGLATVTGFNQVNRGVEQVIRIDDALRRGFGAEDVALSPRLSRAGGSYTG